MTVYEIGIMRDGVLLTLREYHTTSTVDKDLKSALFSALETASQSTFGDSLDFIQLKTMGIIYSKSPRDEGKFVAYAICDRNTDFKLAKGILSKILEQFLKDYSDNLNSPKRSDYENFKEKIDTFFKDLSEKPEERARSLFG
nr:hypothetical protein [Candidatus Freyarchaeota archaeon]